MYGMRHLLTVMSYGTATDAEGSPSDDAGTVVWAGRGSLQEYDANELIGQNVGATESQVKGYATLPKKVPIILPGMWITNADPSLFNGEQRMYRIVEVRPTARTVRLVLARESAGE